MLLIKERNKPWIQALPFAASALSVSVHCFRQARHEPVERPVRPSAPKQGLLAYSPAFPTRFESPDSWLSLLLMNS